MQAFNSAFRGYSDPSSASVDRQARLSEYDLFWSYYENSTFDRANEILWTKYKKDQRLVAFLRSLYNPTAKLVDFYAGAVYPGVVAADGKELPGGIPLAVPLARDTDDDLKGAIGQVLRWSNWQTAKDLYVTYGAATGDVGLEILDAWDRSKVLLVPRWPGHVVDLERDPEGNVTYYALEYTAEDRKRDADGRFTDEFDSYLYRREVDREVIRTFRDGQPEDYDGAGAVQSNPYGFVPFVWVEHRNRGGDHGAPAIAGSLPKLEAINHLLSILVKDTEVVSRSPKVLASTSALSPALSAEAAAVLNEAEITLDLLKGGADTSVHDLGTNLDVAATLELVRVIIGFVEQDHPEITFYEKLREMSQVTGPAARRLVGDSQQAVTRAAGGYDDGLMRGCQMAISVATIRRQGPRAFRWQKDTDAQKAFAKFTPASYDAGALTFEISPRPLIEETPQERWEAEEVRARAATGWVPLLGSKVLALKRVEITPEDITEAFTDEAEAIKAEQLLAQRDTMPDGEEVPAQ